MVVQRTALAARMRSGNVLNAVTEDDIARLHEAGVANDQQGGEPGNEDDEDDFEDEGGDLLGALCGLKSALLPRAKGKAKAKSKGPTLQTPASSIGGSGSGSRTRGLAQAQTKPAMQTPSHKPTSGSVAFVSSQVAPAPSPQKSGRPPKRDTGYQYDPQAYLDADGMKELQDILGTVCKSLQKDFRGILNVMRSTCYPEAFYIDRKTSCGNLSWLTAPGSLQRCLKLRAPLRSRQLGLPDRASQWLRIEIADNLLH